MCFWTRLDYIDVFGPAHQPVTNHIFSDSVSASQRPEWFTQLADGSWVLREDAFEEFIGRCFLNQLRRARTLSTDYKICTPPHLRPVTWVTPMYVFVQATLHTATYHSGGLPMQQASIYKRSGS